MPHSKYDLTKYDIGGAAQGQQKERTLTFACELAASVGIAAEILRLSIFSTGLAAEVELVPCWFRVQKISSALLASADVGINKFRILAKELDLLAIFELQKIQSNKANAAIELKQKLTLNAIHSNKIKNKIDFDAVVTFAFDKLRYPIATGSLMAVLDVVSTTSKQISIGVTIPPGGTLVVDCENYTVYLDGVNVYKFYAGDWLQLSRDTLSVAVDSGTGGALSGTLSYVERYL